MKFLSTMSFYVVLLAISLGSARGAELKIVAAENFYGGVAREIAGKDAQITSILTNPNQDPHEFTTNANTARAVADADVVIYSGISYDPWMEKLLATPGRAHRVVIVVADLIGAKEGANPHIWYDPRTMPALAAKLVEILSGHDAAGAEVYRKRQSDFQKAMQPELAEIAEIKASYAGVKVTATEPVFGYMADALGLKMLNGSFQIKIMNDAEPSVQETAKFEQSLVSKTARILFYNSQVTDPTTERIQGIARGAGIPVVGVTETEPPDQTSYAGWMLHQLAVVETALQASH